MAIALLLLLVGAQVLQRDLAVKWLAAFALIGALSIWFSYPSAFVLAGVGATLGLSCLMKGEGAKVIQLITVGSIWVASFAASYLLSPIGELVNDGGFIRNSVAASQFIPFPPLSTTDAQWYLTDLFELFDNPGGLFLTGIAILAFLIGCASAMSANRNRSLLMLSPLVITVLVSATHLYPFIDRWILFLVPVMLLFVAEGAAFILEKTRHAYPMIGIIVVGLLLLHPVASEVFRLIEPRGGDDIRTVIKYTSEHRKDGDALYVYHGARKAFLYYSEKFNLGEGDYTMGTNSSSEWEAVKKLEHIVAELAELRGNDRVWVLFSNVQNTGSVNDKEFILYQLDQIGTKTDSFRSERAVVYLYDLKE